MSSTRTHLTDSINDLIERIASGQRVSAASVWPFYEFADFIAELLSLLQTTQSELYVAGHVTPDVEIAADRAGLNVCESFGSSPFAADIESLLSGLTSSKDIIYLSNPNRVSGATFTQTEIEMIANVNPEGWLIIDEQYVDFYGQSVLEMASRYPHLIVVRSFTAAFGATSVQSGYMVASSNLVQRFCERGVQHDLTVTVRKLIMMTMTGNEVLEQRLKSLHEETARIAAKMSQLGVENRITPTDFILMRVADPTQTGNFLASCRVTVENLDGYPQLKNYMRYRVQSTTGNDDFLRALSRTPVEHVRMESPDTRLSRLHRGSEVVDPVALSVTAHRKIIPSRGARTQKVRQTIDR